jgi:transcriptional regulator with XRE-family HTH domain
MRKEAGLTQGELADRTGTTQESVSQYENGRRPLNLDWMKIFARELGCSVADLLDEDDNPDRLADDERALIGRYRTADQTQRDTLQRVSAAVIPTYRSPQPDEEAA